MVESSENNSKYGGLSRRDFEIRKKMAAKFGRQVSHLQPPAASELKVDADLLYKKASLPLTTSLKTV